MTQRLQVMLSSTTRDLPKHRRELVEACLRQGAFPLRMEDLPANSENAATVSLRMVDEADVYIGVFAQRYGYVPKINNSRKVSITELEYNRAVERKIERLIFIMDPSHSPAIGDVEIDNAAKLNKLKNRLCVENIVKFFRSPLELRGEVINSLSKLRQCDQSVFHNLSEIPSPPEAFIAHPYTLLQTSTLIGRQHELNLLTSWANGKELESQGRNVAGSSIRIMNIIGIGGTGKSALTWKWFNDIAPNQIKPLRGRMWWSFYESDATFENFIARALAYVSHSSIDDVREISSSEREEKLLAIMDREPFLIGLDGLERILVAYARMDAARLDDGEVGGEKNLRRTADPRVGSFLKKMAQLKHSRIVVSSRLSPTELETEVGDPKPGTFRLNLEGLNEEDALELWGAFGVSGSKEELVSVFNTFAKHPLLLQVLAGEVKRYRRSPGDFTQWRKANPLFHPGRFGKVNQAMGHILGFALRGLNERPLKVLQTLAAFRMPTSYDTLLAVTVGGNKVCVDESELDSVLGELEDRGLLGWDRRANRYDLHPIVRGVVWNALSADAQRGVFEGLHDYFESLPVIDGKFERVDDLTAFTQVIELYNVLIGLGKFDDAMNLFTGRLYPTALYRLNASSQSVELLEMLFSNKQDWSAHLTHPEKQAAALTLLGLAYDWSGRPGRARELLLRANIINQQLRSHLDVCVNNSSLSSSLRLTGKLREAEAAARTALQIARTIRMTFVEASSLYWLGLVLLTRGVVGEAGLALYRALSITRKGKTVLEEATTCAFVAEFWNRLGNIGPARQYADLSWRIAESANYKRIVVRAARRQGITALQAGDLATADERLHVALTRARAINFAEEELPALIGLSELRLLQNDIPGARTLLDDVWDLAERGPYPLFQSDAFNVLAKIEKADRNTMAAVDAANNAYSFAWCDGPPFSYTWGLEEAKKHLTELGAPEPALESFNESNFEPMPQIEIDLEDQFHVGKVSENDF